MKKILFSLFTFLILALFIIWYLFFPNSASLFDNKIKDEMFLIRGEINTTNSIVIVDIDEKSLKALGQWPWSRDVISQILVNLANKGAGIIGLDTFFAEQDTKSPYYLAKKYNLKIEGEDYDLLLANILQQTPTILGYLFDFETNLTKNVLPNVPAIFVERGKKGEREFLLNASGYIGNIPIIQQSAYSAGFVNMVPDIDGVVRYVPLLIKYQGVIYPSLAFEMFRIATGARKVIVQYSEAGVEYIQIGNYKIKTDRFGRLFINYRGDKKKKFKYISAIDVYENNFEELKDKFVLIGTSANGLFDLRVTPFDNVFPGVEVHANIIDNLLKGDFLYTPDSVEIIDISVFIVIAILLSLISYFLTPLVIIISLILLISAIFIFGYYLLFYYGYSVNLFLPIVEAIVLGIALTTINYFLEFKRSENLKKAFAKKVSNKVMEELLKNGTDTILAPKEKEITIFFSDIRSFTTLSEKLGDPNKVINLLNVYMTPMVENITKHKGTIDKFIGDAIMAYWNAPIDVTAHYDEAVSSAIEQIKTLKELNPSLEKEFGISIEIGIGINSGVATIGEMGSSGRADYTIIGDNVNLASRLEGLNKVYGTHIIISEFTYHKLQKEYIIRELDLVKVKGKEKAVKIYEVIDFGKREFKEYEKGLELYRKGSFEEAKQIFENLYSEEPLKLYQVYIERCDYFIKNPPHNFDGAWKFTTK